MTTSVFHTGYGIELNLSLEDLGHPEREGLWEEIYKPRPFPRGLLLCMGLDNEGVECPASMYVKIRRGKKIASHLDKGIKPHNAQGEGPRHRALKERIALSAQRSGFDTLVEDVAEDGRRRTDVLVKGPGGRMIGWEVQLVHVTAAAVVKRSNRAQRDGIVPLWTVDDVKARRSTGRRGRGWTGSRTGARSPAPRSTYAAGCVSCGWSAATSAGPLRAPPGDGAAVGPGTPAGIPHAACT